MYINYTFGRENNMSCYKMPDEKSLNTLHNCRRIKKKIQKIVFLIPTISKHTRNQYNQIIQIIIVY